MPGKENVVADALSRRPDLAVNAISEIEITQETKDQICEALEADPEFSSIIETLASNNRTSKVSKSYLEHFELKNGLLFYDGHRLCLPKGPHRTQTIQDHHDAEIAGHQGFERTYERIHQNYYWPRMTTNIKEYIRSCDSCQRVKASQKRPAGLLQPMPIPEAKWESVSMDFITHLLTTSNGNDAIVVFVDMLTKMAHFVAMKTTDSAPTVARLFFDHVFRLHGLPKRIVSDRDARFTSRFWKSLLRNLGTTLAMSTAYHPQTDGQTERTNRTLEDMLRAYVGYDQSDWDKKLTAAEFAYNSAPNASTKHTPFALVYGHNPKTPASFFKLSNDTVQATSEFLKNLDNLTNRAKDNLALAKKRQEEYANTLRRDAKFEEGEKVLLLAAHIQLESQTARPSKKLQARYIGPYRIEKKISSVTYRLELPATLKIHPVFHVSLLKKYEEPTNIPYRKNPREPPPAVVVDDHEEFEVEKILDERVRRQKKEYLVHWKGYPEYDSSWEPAMNLQNAKEAVREFHERKGGRNIIDKRTITKKFEESIDNGNVAELRRNGGNFVLKGG